MTVDEEQGQSRHSGNGKQAIEDASERSMAPRSTAYARWREEEGLLIADGYYCQDLRTVPVAYWKRMGALATFFDCEELNDVFVCEIPPGESTLPLNHLYEVMIYVLAGSGITSIRNADQAEAQQFEWHAGSMFAIPPNVIYRHYNASGSEAARFVAVSSAPVVMNLFNNDRFVFDNRFVFNDRYDGVAGRFNGDGIARSGKIWETNFLPDVRGCVLQADARRGRAASNIRLEIGAGALTAHVSEFPVGTYKKAHRHRKGPYIVVISGSGYSLMWPEGSEKRQFDWQSGSLIAPPDSWFHQHFNTSSVSARYLAIRWNSARSPLYRQPNGISLSVKEGGDQIEYEDQDVDVDERFNAAIPTSMTDDFRRNWPQGRH